MNFELSLILLLLISVCALSILLFIRIQNEKKQQRLLQQLSIKQLPDFMKKNSVDGSIATIARLFSDILKQSFNCEYIIFVRKKRGLLELNYYHGIKSFQRTDFKINYSNELMQVLKEDFFPRNISSLDPFLPKKFKAKISQFQMDSFFPVFWRDNLYGFYVIKSNDKINSDSFRLVIAQLVQSLAAAYHIKWHESKLEQLHKREEEVKISSFVSEGEQHVERVLKLMKFKKTDAIIPQIISTLQETSQVEDLIYIYQSKEVDETEYLFVGKQPKNLQVPNIGELKSVDSLIKKKIIVPLDELAVRMPKRNSWIQSLKQNKINRIASFPLSSTRDGVLAWRVEKC